MAAAVDAYRGELLPEDGPAEWVIADREQWRLRVAGACTRLAALHSEKGDLRAAAEAARRGLEVDPFCDPLWRALIDALAATGDTAAEAPRPPGVRRGAPRAGRRPPARPDRASVTPLLPERTRIGQRPFRPAGISSRPPVLQRGRRR